METGRKIRAARSVRELTALIEDHGYDFSANNVSNAFDMLARVHQRKVGDSRSDEEWADDFDAVSEAVHRLMERSMVTVRKLTPQGMCSIADALVRLEVKPDHDFLTALTQQALMAMPFFATKHLANFPFALARLGFTPSEDWLSALVNHVGMQLNEFKAMDLSRLLFSLARFQFTPHPEVRTTVLSRVQSTCSDLSAFEVSKVFWSLGVLSLVPPPKALAELSRHAVTQMGSFSPQNLVNTIQAHASWKVRPDASLEEALSRRAVEIVDQFSAKEVSVMLHSAAVLQRQGLGHFSHDLTSHLARQALNVQEDFTAQGVSITLWAFAKLGFEPGQEVLDGLTEQVLEVAADLKAEQVARLLWVLGTLGVQADRDLYIALTERVMQVLPEFTEQGVALTLWSLARMGVAMDDALITALMQRAEDVMHDFTLQGVSNMLWALARIRHADPACVDPLLCHLRDADLREMSGQAVANILWSLSHFHLLSIDEQLQAKLTRQLEGRARDLNPQEIANSLWALSQLGEDCESPVWRAVEAQISLRIDEFDAHSVANTLNAFRNLNVEPRAELLMALDRVAARFPPRMPDEDGEEWEGPPVHQGARVTRGGLGNGAALRGSQLGHFADALRRKERFDDDGDYVDEGEMEGDIHP